MIRRLYWQDAPAFGWRTGAFGFRGFCIGWWYIHPPWTLRLMLKAWRLDRDYLGWGIRQRIHSQRCLLRMKPWR